MKGHKHLIEALAMLKGVREDWECWLLGDGPLENQYGEQVRSLGLEAHVQFWGPRQDVPELLSQADVFVLPSLQDNLPFSIMEAQIAGKAAVVSDAGGIPEMVKHGKTGLVSPAGQSEPLFQNLRRMLESDRLRTRLGEQAKRWALEHWSIETMMKKTLKVYDTVMKRRFVNREGA